MSPAHLRTLRRLALSGLCLALASAPAMAQKGVPPGNPDPAEPVRAVHLDEFTEGATNAIELDGVGASILAQPGGDGTTIPVFVIETLSGEVLRFEGEPSYFSFLPVSLTIAHLDPSTDLPEVLATSYTGGAHCCERVQIAALQPNGSWSMSEFGSFDGGYALVDPDGNGVGEIEIADQSFLYTFDCYACSLPPPRFFRIEDGAVVDVSDDPALRPAYEEELSRFELTAEQHNQPGFLAGWAGMRARLGEGEAALATIADVYSGEERFSICTTGGSTYDCAPQDLQDMTFVEFLRFHLIEQGYLAAGGKG